MKQNIIVEKTGIKNLKKLLMRVHVVSREQALYILNYFDDPSPENTLSSLIKTHTLFEVGANGIGVSPKSSYNYETVNAVWLLLKYISSIDLDNVYLAQEPCSLFFLMNNEMYEIAVIQKGREAQTAYALNYRTKNNSELKYIALLSEPEQLDTLFNEVEKFPSLNVVYTLITGKDEKGMLIINIMSRK